MAEPKMLKAIHPYQRKIITPKEFIAEFGMDYKKKGVFPKCIHCGEDVFTYGTSSIEVTSRFKHHNGMSCDTSTIGGGKHPGIDIIHGDQIKKEFCESETICKSYSLCLSMAGKGNLSIKTFFELCKKADKKNIWSYVGVEIWMIPYMLLTLKDLTLIGKNKKPFNIRFVLDKNFDVLSKERNCNIEKIYTNSQKKIASFEVNQNQFNNTNISWFPESLTDKLASYCE